MNGLNVAGRVGLEYCRKHRPGTEACAGVTADDDDLALLNAATKENLKAVGEVLAPSLDGAGSVYRQEGRSL